jgi:hypothetical protein
VHFTERPIWKLMSTDALTVRDGKAPTLIPGRWGSCRYFYAVQFYSHYVTLTCLSVGEADKHKMGELSCRKPCSEIWL